MRDDYSQKFCSSEQSTLLLIARDSVKWAATSVKARFDFTPYQFTTNIKEELASFVTLKQYGLLRGCIGMLQPNGPLYKSLHDNAVSAAMYDTRFQPVHSEELKSIRISVSVLSPIRPIRSLSEIELGRDGIIFRKGSRSSVFLPEVPVEQGWSLEETLSHLSLKAGLPGDAWQVGSRFEVFQSIVFSE